MRLREVSDPDHLPALDVRFAKERPALPLGDYDPPPRILLLYGSLRERSYSRLVVEEAARLLRYFGAETRIFDPSDLPLPDLVKGDDHAVRPRGPHRLKSVVLERIRNVRFQA
jgi:arsenic resistance protein ArsH